jgi:hypothetical protein
MGVQRLVVVHDVLGHTRGTGIVFGVIFIRDDGITSVAIGHATRHIAVVIPLQGIGRDIGIIAGVFGQSSRIHARGTGIVVVGEIPRDAFR